MGAHVRCEFCGQSRPNGQECFTHGDMKDCAFLKREPVGCGYGECVSGKGDPPHDCSAPDCYVVKK